MPEHETLEWESSTCRAESETQGEATHKNQSMNIFSLLFIKFLFRFCPRRARHSSI